MKQLIALGLAAVLALFQMSVAGAADSKEVAVARTWLKQNVPGLPSQVLDAAIAEGKVMTYCQVSGCPQPLVDAFHQVFPFIDVQIYRAPGGALAERFTSEARANRTQADVVMNSSVNVLDHWVSDGYIMNWVVPNGDLVPQAFRRDGYWYGIGLLNLGLAWNTDKVTPDERKWLENVASWKDIGNPAFKGRTALTHVRAGGSAHIVYYYLRETLGSSYLQNIKTNLDPVVFDSSGSLSERLASGEYAYSPIVPIDFGVLQDIASRGAPIGWRVPEPVLAVTYVIGISKNAPHANAAKIFMVWSASLAGQSAFVNAAGLGPMRSDIADNRALIRSKYYKRPKTFYAADWKDIDKKLGQMVSEFTRMFNK